MTQPCAEKGRVAIVWFRKCLRIHDNAALLEACKTADSVYPIFIIDPHFTKPNKVGVNRYNFLLESLHDLDSQFRTEYNSRLFVLRGSPKAVFQELLESGKPLLSQKPTDILWEKDTEPYAKGRDAEIIQLAESAGIKVQTFSGHTLYDLEEALKKNKGKAPTAAAGMVTLSKLMGDPAQPLPRPASVPRCDEKLLKALDGKFLVPSLEEMGYTKPEVHCGFPGGETEGLRRMKAATKDSAFVCNFEKPKTRSSSFNPPSTTVLSPYIKFGCVSVRTFYHEIKEVQRGKKHTEPPVSLIGQLHFREISYLQGMTVPNFDRQEGNTSCKQIPWVDDNAKLTAWEEGRTGYPFIDAAMRQLRRTGWMHHLARHAVACFLTRGDLWVSWERGRDVFDKLLLDADWAINNFNWLWLAGVAPWSTPFFRVYHPVPKMTSSLNVQDQEGVFIREFVPELKNMPSKYIYAPWTAPIEVQKKAGCVIGVDYPKPIVDHDRASKENIANFKAALDASKGEKRPQPSILQQLSSGPDAKKARK